MLKYGHVTIVTIFTFICLIGPTLSIAAQQHSEGNENETSVLETESKVIPPQAEALIRKVSLFYQSLQTFEVTCSFVMHPKNDSGSESLKGEQQLRVQRPNQLSLVRQDGIGGNVYMDGEFVVTHFPEFQNYYLREVSPKDLDALYRVLNEAEFAAPLALINHGNFLAFLLADHPLEIIKSSAQSVQYAAVRNISGVRCEGIRFQEGNTVIHLWIQNGNKPLIHAVQTQLVLKADEAMRSRDAISDSVSPSEEEDLLYEVDLFLKGWNFNPNFTLETFRFQAMEGSESIKSFLPVFDQYFPARKRIGDFADEMNGELLDGSTFNLKSHLGKRAVILYFWSLECEPCLENLAYLHGITSQDKYLRLIAVNPVDDAPSVRQYLKEKNLRMDVFLDRDQSILNGYGMSNVPFSIYISESGVIRDATNEILTQEKMSSIILDLKNPYPSLIEPDKE